MKALSIQQPWAWLITRGHKDIENREWYTDYRGFILIHAGKKMDSDGLATVTAGMGKSSYTEPVPLHYREAWDDLPLYDEFDFGGIVGYATLQKVVTQSDNPWFTGKYGFVLTQRHHVDFIPLRGQLGLFDVPQEIEIEINRIRDERAMEGETGKIGRIEREQEHEALMRAVRKLQWRLD